MDLPDRRRARKPFTVDLLLTPEHRTEYLAFLADGRTTLEKAIAWLKERGYDTLSWGAVYRHRKKFLDGTEEVRRWAAVAAHVAAAAEQGGRHALAAGTLAKFEQLLLQTLYAVKSGGALTSRELADLAAALNKTVASRTQLEALRTEFETRQREAIEQARKMNERATPQQVALRMREILGV
jgi:hypothetical protein